MKRFMLGLPLLAAAFVVSGLLAPLSATIAQTDAAKEAQAAIAEPLGVSRQSAWERFS